MSRIAGLAGVFTLWLFASAMSGTGASPKDAAGILMVAAPPDASRRIDVARVARRKIAGRISATATIEPDARAVAQVTTTIPARVVKLLAEPGELVRAGQPLAIVSSVELSRAKAEFLKARALKEINAKHLARERELYAGKIAALKDVLNAEADYDTALAQFQAARETLRVVLPGAELSGLDWTHSGRPLSEFPLVSPISGSLVRRELTIGEQIDSSAQPLTVINLDRLWVIANVFEHDLKHLANGARATVVADAYPGRTFSGTVSYVSDVLDRATRTVKARIDVPNPSHVLKPGMFAHAEIEGGGQAREALAIPVAAVYDLDGEKIVFVVATDSTFAVRRVTLGAAGDGSVEVVSGLGEGERVATRGAALLKGMLVNGAPR